MQQKNFRVDADIISLLASKLKFRWEQTGPLADGNVMIDDVSVDIEAYWGKRLTVLKKLFLKFVIYLPYLLA